MFEATSFLIVEVSMYLFNDKKTFGENFKYKFYDKMFENGNGMCTMSP